MQSMDGRRGAGNASPGFSGLARIHATARRMA
jgi:hypothetical protein